MLYGAGSYMIIPRVTTLGVGWNHRVHLSVSLCPYFVQTIFSEGLTHL